MQIPGLEEFNFSELLEPERRMDVKAQTRWRFLLDMGGDNGPNVQRPWWILASGSLLFRVESEFLDWPWVAGLRPWEHYVPVDAELVHLAPRVAWARQHDAQARRMQAAGRARARELFDPVTVLRYLHAVIREYAELFPV